MRNFGDERADGETKKEEREENRNNVLMREKFRGKNIINFFFFFYNTATVQKILQYCYLQFSNARVFEAENAKFSLH